MKGRDLPVHALTVRDPWATLIAMGAKQIETRSYRTRHRGPIAIHSSKALKPEDQQLCLQEPFHSMLEQVGIQSPSDMAKGAIIAIAEIVGCEQVPHVPEWEWYVPGEPERSFGFYSPGRWMWRLSNIERLAQPVPIRGMLGLWQLSEPAIGAMLAQRTRGNL